MSYTIGVIKVNESKKICLESNVDAALNSILLKKSFNSFGIKMFVDNESAAVVF